MAGVNFSGISRGSIFGRLVRAPLRLIPSGMKMPIIQGPLKGKRWIAGSHNHGCWLGSYEFDKQQLFIESIAAGNVVFDVGANVGYYTLLASQLVGPSGRVYSFEPLPRNLKYLREHIRINKLGNVDVLDEAVSDREGTVKFDDQAGSATGSISDRGQLTVKTVSLDDLVRTSVARRPQFIKIDVEGGEALVLRGAEKLLRESHPVIFLATHGAQVHAECVRFLQSCGYSLRAIGGATIESTDELLATPAS